MTEQSTQEWLEKQLVAAAAPEFTTEIQVYPGFDYVNDPDPDKATKGRHGMVVYFILKGPLGGITWEYNTGIVTSENRWTPHNGGIASHLHEQIQGWEQGPFEGCKVIGAPCYSDIGYLVGDTAAERLYEKGHEGVFEYLREIYDDWTVVK